MRATVPFLAAGMALFAASCGGPSSGAADEGTPFSSKGGSSGADSGASGTDGGMSFAGVSSAGAGGGTATGGSRSNGGSTGSSGAGGSKGGSTGTAGAGGSTPGTCSAFLKDCNGQASDGCETDTSSDPSNCGGCGKACPGAAHAAASCFVGKCDFSCDSGWGDCNADSSDGCEQDLSSDKNNCGACGNVCQNANCVSRTCTCATTTTVPPRIPLDMYILFDQSGSMNDDVTGGKKWDVIKGALTTFVNSQGAVGMRVGIGYFPIRTSGSGGGGFCIPGIYCPGGGSGSTVSCNWTDYAIPDVGIDLIPAVSPTIVTSLGNHGPGGDTPTYPALQGAYDYARIWATANPNRKTIVVLATDGNPTNCGNTNNVNDISNQLVAPARAANPSLLTFVIGVGSSLTNLNQIAASGGTGTAFIVDTAGADPGAQFLAAMQAIQGSAALGCEYGIPRPPSGPPDFGKVNVQFTPLNGSPTLLKKVLDEGSCDPANGGWHYDNEAAPTKIMLCGSSCTAIQSFAGAKVEVQLGCASVG